MSKHATAKARRAKRADTRPAPPAAAQRPRRLAELAVWRYGLYVAAAAALHGAVWYLQATGRLRLPGAPGRIWVPHVFVVVGMVLVRLFAAHGRGVAMGVAV